MLKKPLNGRYNFLHSIAKPNIVGLKGIHSPEDLHWQGGHFYCPWCGKEVQNKGTVVNHLQNVHYCLGLIYTLCWEYFAMSLDTMRWHTSSCKALTTKDKAPEEEEKSESDNSDEDDGYLLEGI